MTAVWELSPYRGERLLIHLALADYANDEGVCWPGQKTLARKARCSQNFVGLALKQMVKDGWLEQKVASNGRGNQARYRLKTLSANGLSEKAHSATSENPFSDGDVTTYLNRHEPSIPSELFDAFWEAYPRKIAKAAAEKAFRKAMKSKDAPKMPELLAAIETYKAGLTDLQYCCHAATWLNQRRWEDAQPKKVARVEVPVHIQGAQSFGSGFALTNATLEDLRAAVAHQEPDYREAAISAYMERKKR